MNVPFSQIDSPSSPIGPDEVDLQVSILVKRALALAAAVSAQALGVKPSEQAAGSKCLDDLRRDFERSVEGFREDLCIALTGREPPRGNVPALVAAVAQFTEERAVTAGERPRDPLFTAMRRVDAAEAAERALVSQALAAGGALAAA